MVGIDVLGIRDLDPLFLGSQFRSFVLDGAARRRVIHLLEDDAAFAECSASSYRHFNDFDKLVLAELGGSRRLVWHQWADPTDESTAEAHNHRWDFVSYVAAGTLDSTEYLIESAEGSGTHVQNSYQSPNGSETYTLEFVRAAELRATRRASYSAGSFYFQPYAAVHLARPLAPKTHTLILQGGVRTSRTDVFQPNPTATDGAGTIERQVRRLSAGELRAALSTVAEQLPHRGSNEKANPVSPL